MIKQTKNTRYIAKLLEFPVINRLIPNLAPETFYWAFYRSSLTLIVGISIVAIFVKQLSACSKIQKTPTTIKVNYF